MNSNLTVGPSFKGTFIVKKVERLVEGSPVYAHCVTTARVDSKADQVINCAFASLLGQEIDKKVIVAADKLEEVLTLIAGKITFPIRSFFKLGNIETSGHILNPLGMTFELKPEIPKVGDFHLFWQSDSPYKALINLVKTEITPSSVVCRETN